MPWEALNEAQLGRRSREAETAFFHYQCPMGQEALNSKSGLQQTLVNRSATLLDWIYDVICTSVF